MNRTPQSALLLACLAFLAAAGALAQTGWLRYEVPQTDTYALRYLPAGLDTSQPVPVVVFLHGSGARPEDWQGLLAPVADAVGVVLVVPRSISNLSFGVGADDVTIRQSLARLGQEVAVDPARISLAGHSAGGAYAYVLAYGTEERYSAVFTLGAPYRQVLRVTDLDYKAPILIYYGTQDPNFQGGSYTALWQQLDRLGVEWEDELRPGFGHSGWPEGLLEEGFAFLREQRYHTPGGCFPTATRLCLQGGRFAVEATWRDFDDRTGPGRPVALRSADSGLLWFFNPDNWEVQVKVLDACTVNGFFWVFASATTNVEYQLTVRDLATGLVKTYDNPLGQAAAAITDVRAFATCSPSP